MINRPSNALMNEADASPGGGAVVTPPAQPLAQPAAASAPPPSLSADDIKSAVAGAFAELKNGLFADLRKAGALKTEKPTDPAPPHPVAPAPALSAVDVEAMLERERVVTRAATQHALTDAQVNRLKGALASEKPASVADWVTGYLSDMGLAKMATPTPPATQPAPEAPKPAPAAPVAPSTHTLPTANGVVDLFSLTPAQLQSLGPQGVRENLEKLWAIGNQMSGRPERPKVPTR